MFPLTFASITSAPPLRKILAAPLVLYSDYIGPARLKLNLPEVAPELKRA